MIKMYAKHGLNRQTVESKTEQLGFMRAIS